MFNSSFGLVGFKIIFIHVDRPPTILRSGVGNLLCFSITLSALLDMKPHYEATISYSTISLLMEVLSGVLFCLYRHARIALVLFPA